MLVPRYFACGHCGTVFADPERPPYCDTCGEDSFAELTRDLQGDDYFTRTGAHRR